MVHVRYTFYKGDYFVFVDLPRLVPLRPEFKWKSHSLIEQDSAEDPCYCVEKYYVTRCRILLLHLYTTALIASKNGDFVRVEWSEHCVPSFRENVLWSFDQFPERVLGEKRCSARICQSLNRIHCFLLVNPIGLAATPATNHVNVVTEGTRTRCPPLL